MKIERVEIFGVAVPLVGEYKNAYLAKTVQKSAIVRITTNLSRFTSNSLATSTTHVLL